MSFPLIFADKVGGSISTEENRYLAAFPKLNIHEGMQEEFENWINDNAGGRTQFKKIYGQVNIELLKSLRDSTNFYIDDWVFLISDSVVQFLQHSDTMDDQQQETFIDDYRKIQEALKNQGILMSSMIYPHKAEMYPEIFENYVLPVTEESQLEVLQRVSEEHGEMNLEVTYKQMKKLVESGKQLYSKAYDESHWNNQGAFEGYKMFMSLVSESLPEVQCLDEKDFTITPAQREKIYNGRTYKEEDFDYAVNESQAVLDMTWFETFQYTSSDMWNSYRYYRNNNTELPKIVIVGDSYTWMFMLPWISESFSETVFIHQLDGGNLQSVIDVVQPDIVVFTGLHNTVEAAIKQIAETDVLSEE